MLTNKQVQQFREEIDTAKNPLFFFDDDQDGICSFLLLYRLHKEGHGTIVKTIPNLTALFLRKIQEYHPDKVFILDIPIVDQEFIDQAKVPLFWMDHHPPLERHNIKYFNPRLAQPDIYIPTTRLAYQIAQNKKDLWLAMVGCIGDYHMPDFKGEFIKQYPHLLKKSAGLDQAIFDEPIGRLVRLFSFILKGKTSEVNKCIKILTRLQSPDEILQQQTSQGKYLYKRFENIEEKYQPLLQKALKIKPQGKLLIFIYPTSNWSFTSELASELIYRHPNKVVVVARKKSNNYRCSIRSKTIIIPELLEKALVGIEGYGGGHEYACGANIQEEDWQQFLENFKRELL